MGQRPLVFLVTVLDSYSRFVVHWELALSMLASEVADIIATALEKVPGKRPGSCAIMAPSSSPKTGVRLIRHFELEEIPIRVRHPESNGRIERYHRSVREEGLGDDEREDYYQARDLLEQWVKYYNLERLHSALNYLRPVDYYKGNPEALLAARKMKLTKATARRKDINKRDEPLKIGEEL